MTLKKKDQDHIDHVFMTIFGVILSAIVALFQLSAVFVFFYFNQEIYKGEHILRDSICSFVGCSVIFFSFFYLTVIRNFRIYKLEYKDQF